MGEESESALKGKFSQDVIWNLASLAILGASGVLLNIIIARYADAATLGVFNQVFAVYIFLSQLCVGGVHFSVLKYISERPEDRTHCSVVANAGLFSALVLSSLVLALIYPASNLIAGVLQSPGVGVGLEYALPGLIVFSLNKVLLSTLNGVRAMRAFAIGQSCRFLGILVVVFLILHQGYDSNLLPLALSLSELVLFLGLAAFTHTQVAKLFCWQGIKQWVSKHFSFGLRGFLSGVFTEVNTRVDILMLGLFLDDASVGVYSFAALLAEGVSQIPYVIRRNVDPIVGKHLAKDEREEIEQFAVKLKQVLLPAMIGISIIGIVVYPFILPYLTGGNAYTASVPVFTILLIAIALNAPFRAFLGIILQGGKPGTFTVFVGLLVLSNVVLNLILISSLGVNGAAIATGSVYLLEAFGIVYLSKKLFEVDISQFRKTLAT